MRPVIKERFQSQPPGFQPLTSYGSCPPRESKEQRSDGTSVGQKAVGTDRI